MHKGQFSEFSHCVLLAGRDNVVFRLVLLQHEPHSPHVLARMAPIAARVQIAEPDLFHQAELDPRGMRRDLARDELEPPVWRLVIVQDARRGLDAIGLPIVARQMKPGHLRDPVSGPGVEERLLGLWDLFYLAEHLARGGEVEPAVRRAVAQCREYMMRAVDVRIERGELVLERIGDEALGGQMVAFMGLDRLEHPVDAREALQGRGMQVEAVLQVQNAPEPVLRIFDRHPPDDAMHLIAFVQEQLGQVRPILPGDAGDQGALHGATGSSNRMTAFSGSETLVEKHTSELQSLAYLVCRLLLEKKKKNTFQDDRLAVCERADTEG